MAPDPGARNFRIFITPKKITSFYSKDFLPKLIFLRKGVHHPKFRFSGVVAKFPDFRGRTDLSEMLISIIFAGSGTFCQARIFGTIAQIFGNTNGLGFDTEFKEKPAIV